MSWKNPNSEISAENCETLGPKIQNGRKFTLRVSGDVLEEALLSYVNFIPNVQVLRDKTKK